MWAQLNYTIVRLTQKITLKTECLIVEVSLVFSHLHLPHLTKCAAVVRFSVFSLTELSPWFVPQIPGPVRDNRVGGTQSYGLNIFSLTSFARLVGQTYNSLIRKWGILKIKYRKISWTMQKYNCFYVHPQTINPIEQVNNDFWLLWYLTLY